MPRHQPSLQGFTLIEMVVVMVLIGILAGVLFTVLSGPMKAYVSVERKARLVDIAETALQRMTREIRLALPNSVRTNGTTALEFLRTLDGGRYRGQGANRLKFNTQADTFEFLGPLNNFASIITGGAGQADCMVSPASAHCMVVYNTGQAGANAYDGDNIAAVTAKAGNTLTFNLSPTTRFPLPSPQQRFYIVDTPVSFICSGNQIVRYGGYTIQSVQPIPPGTGTANLLIDQLAGCSFSYDPGTSTRAGLVSVSVTIQDPATGETITLLQQAHVDNSP